MLAQCPEFCKVVIIDKITHIDKIQKNNFILSMVVIQSGQILKHITKMG